MADNPNPNIEERIVAAKFDASDFEKGVNKTIKKLDELNDKLDFKKSGESVTDFAKKTSEAQEKASSSLEKLTDRYTTFIGMLKQKFISGVADQVVDVFFRMEKAALSFAKSMTFDQISAGLAKYESALTSVRMIVNSYKTVKNEITGITEKVHYTQDEAYNAIGNLQAYADETSYSMAQMTDAMSKMVSAGVGLDQAEKNVQGIANACAAAGVNASDAARAFYNLSQAYSSGTLKYTDYRSLQLLNMTNENFEEQLIAAGLKAGTLKETTDKKGNKLYTTKKSATNKKVTAGKKFTRSQAADYLKYGWADTEVMDYLFGNNFYVDVNDFYTARELEEAGKISNREDYLKNLKDYEAIGSWIEKLSDKDNEWKKKYESVKDNATERKKIIDQLIIEADEVAKAATKHGKIKDEDLLKWIDKLEDADSRKINYKKIKDNQKERRKFLDDLKKNDADVKEQVKGENLGLSVEQLEKYIQSLDKNHEMRKKYDDMNAAQRKTYLKSLIEEAQSLGKIKNKYDEIAVKAFLAAREARNLRDVINAIADYVSSKWTKVFENLIGTLEDASKFFTALSEGGIASLFTDFADWVAEVSDAFNLGGAGSAQFRETILSLDEALGNLLGLFNVLLPSSDQFGQTLFVISGDVLRAVDSFRDWTAVVHNWFSDTERLERIRGIFANLSGVFGVLGKVATIAFNTIGRTLSALSPVFDAVITALNKITEPIGQLGDKNNTAPFDAIKESLDNLFKILDPLSEKLAPIIVGIGDIFGEVAKFFIGGAIDTAIANIQFFSDAFGLLFELIFGKENSAQAENGHGVIDGIMKSVEDLSNVCHSAIITVGDFFKNLFADLRTLFGIKPKDGETIAEGGVFANITNFLDTNEFIQKAKDWFAKAKVDVQKWFDQAVIDVKAWFESLPSKITKAISSVLYEKKDGETVATPLKVWLDGAVESVSNFIANIPSYIVQGIGKITDVFGYIIDLLFGKKEETNKEKTEAEKLTEQTINNWRKTFLSKIIAALKSIPDQVKKLFENTKAKFNKALGTIKKWFNESETGKQIKAFGAEILTGIKNFIIGLPENIKKLIQGVGSIGRQVISTIKEIIGIGNIGDEVQDGMEKDIKKISLTGIIDTIIDLGATLANEFLSWFTGVNDIEYNFNWFVSQVVGFIKAIPGKIWDGIMYLGKELSGFWSYIVSQLRHDDTPSEQADKFATDHPVIAGIVKNIVKWIEGIPGQLQTAWSNALTGINEFWSGLTGYWTKLDRINEIQNELKNMDYNDPKRYGLEYELNALNNTKTGFEKNNPQIAEFTKMIHGWVTNFTTTLSSSWDAAKITIETFFNTLPDTLSQAWQNAKETVTQFFTEFVAFWNDPTAFATGNGEEDAKRPPTQFEINHPKIAGFIIGFRKWLNSIPGSLSEAFNNAITGVGSFFKSFSVYWTQLSRIQEIQSKLKDSNISDADRNLLEADLRDLQANPTDFEKQYPFISGIVGSFHGWISDIPAQLSQTWEWAKTEISTFWTEFIDFITHPEKWSTNMPEGSELTPFEEKHKVLSGWIISIADFIKNIPTVISSTWEEAKNTVITFFTEFMDFITKPEAWDTSNTSGRQVTDFENHYPNLAKWLGTAATWISSLPGIISKTWEDTKTAVITFWDEFWTFISNPDNWSEDKKQDRELTAFEGKYPELAQWAGGLARSISNLPETLATSFNESKDKLQKFFAGFSDFWSMETIRKQLEGMADGPERNALQKEFDRLSGSDVVKNFKTDHPVVSDMVTTLVGWVSEIPVKISETMTSVTTSLNNFWTDLVKAFNGDNLSKEDAAKSESLGERVRDWIINFFVNLPTYITDGIHAVLGLVNSGFTGLTDLFKSNTIIDDKDLEKQITNNAEAALEKLDDTTKQVIEETTNAAGETADDIDKNPTPKDNFLQGIVSIGKTFYDIITKTIPGFIVAGFDWIKLNWTKEGGIKDSLLNIFTDVTGIKPTDFHLENLGAKIGEALQNLPKIIGKGFNKASSWITDIFGIKKQLPKEWEELIKSTSSVPDSIKYELKKNWDRLGYDVGDSAEDSSIWSSITNISDSIGEALRTVFFNIVNSDFGTWIITGWNNSLGMFKKVFDSLSKWFSGETDDLGEAVNEIADDSINDEGKSIITSIGETISTLITETIPKFIGGAIGKIVSILPDIWKNLWGGITGSFEASAEEVNKDNSKAKTDIEKAGETATESIEQVDDIISTMFDAFKTGAISNAILVIGGLYLVVKIIKALHGLVSEFTVTGNLAEKAAAKNSIEAVFKRMLAAIIAAMALVVYMSQLNDAQYKRAEATLDKLMSFFEILAGVYAGIQLVKTGGDIVGEVKDAKDTAETLGDTFLGIVKGYGTIKIVETGVEGIGGSISDVISMITGNFTEITGALDIFSKMMPDAIQRIVNAKDNFNTAIEVIGDTVTLVGKMKEVADKKEDVDAAKLVIRQLRLSLGGLAQVFKGDFHADAIYDGLTKIMGLVLSKTMTDFIDFVQKDNTFNLFKESIASLGAAMSLYDGINLNSTITENGINNALEILKSIIGNDELMGLAKKLTPESFGVSSAEMLETSERVIVFSSAVSRIGAAFKDFSGTTATGLNEFITAVQSLSIDDAFAEGISSGEAGIVSFSEKMTALGDGLSAFGVAIQDFKDEDVTNAGRALDMVAALAERLDETGKSFLGKMFTGGTNLSEFANQIGVLGTGLQTFMNAVHPIEDANGKMVDWDFNNIIVAMYALNEVAKAAKTLGGVAFTEAAADISGLHQLLNIGESTGTTIGTSIAKFVAELSDIPDDKTIDYSAVLQNIEAFSNFASALYNLKGVNIQEVIDNLTRGFGLKMYSGTAQYGWVTVEDNAFLKLINYLFDVYTQITTRMNAVNVQISDIEKGTVTVSLKTKINDVKLFFGIISDVFETIGDMLTDNTQWRIISARGDTTTSFETKTNDVGVVIESLVEAMSTLQMNTETLFSAIDALSEYDSDDKIAKAQVIVSILKDLSYIWQLFGSESNTFVGNPLEGIAALNSINTEQAVSGIKKLVSVIDESIKETSVTSDLVESGKSMAVYIIQGIQEAFDSDDDMYKPKVHIVLDDSTVKEQMAGLFGVNNDVDFNISAGFAEAVQQAFGGSETFTSLSSDVGSIKETIGELKLSVDGLQGELTAVQTAFGGMKVFLYKDELVGYITPDITAEQDRLSEIQINEASHK